MLRWIWVLESTVYAIHSEQIAEHGGLDGVRDTTLLESALVRPQHLAHYEQPGAAELAASYGYGIARNHPFYDGNKRTAFVVVELFLTLNGYALIATDEACIAVILDVASGTISEAEFTHWIKGAIQSLNP